MKKLKKLQGNYRFSLKNLKLTIGGLKVHKDHRL